MDSGISQVNSILTEIYVSDNHEAIFKTKECDLINLLQNMKSMEQLEFILKGTYKCIICNKITSKNDSFNLPCKHTSHNNCLLEYIKQKSHNRLRQDIFKKVKLKCSEKNCACLITEDVLTGVSNSFKEKYINVKNTLENDTSFYCLFCQGDDDVSSKFELECGGIYCKEMLVSSVRNLRGSMNFKGIVCPFPSCKKRFTNRDIERLIVNETELALVKETILAIENAQNNPNSIFINCLKCNAENFLENVNVKLLNCIGCGYIYCVNCNKAANKCSCNQVKEKCPKCATDVKIFEFRKQIKNFLVYCDECESDYAYCKICKEALQIKLLFRHYNSKHN
jgi:hypothetical protein